jgi:hypothetical protein
MIRKAVIAVALTLVGTATANAQTSTRPATVVALRGYHQLIKLDTLVIWKEVLATPGAVFSSARQILDSLKIKIHIADSARGVLHANFHSPGSRIAGRQRSWTVRCGVGFAGDYADTWRLSLAYVVYIEPGKDGGTRIGTAFFGGGDPVEGVSKASMPCPSTGNMEELLFKAVQLRVL